MLLSGKPLVSSEPTNFWTISPTNLDSSVARVQNIPGLHNRMAADSLIKYWRT